MHCKGSAPCWSTVRVVDDGHVPIAKLQAAIVASLYGNSRAEQP